MDFFMMFMPFMAGMSTINTYDPDEIRGVGTEDFISLPCTIEEGQDLDIGQVIGKRPTSEKYIAYNKDAAASATSPQADAGNTGNGTCSTVEVQDNYTRTENWTLTCTETAENGGTFSVVGSVSGNVGNALVGSEFKYPNNSAYMVKFTISDGSSDFAEGDKFTFSTIAAGARIAEGILMENIDASSADVLSGMYVKGNFVESKLIDLDSQAKEDLNGKSVGDYFII